MKLLIIGGTRFVGRHLVEAALERGHQITLFNRGKSNPDIYPQVERIVGDRETDLDKLAGQSWDAVIDTCGYYPRIVDLSAQALKDSVGQYVFISTVSVYADFDAVDIDEDYQLGTIEDGRVEEINAETYGPLKVLCEKAVQEIYAERALIVRPGLIVGPYDPTDRFTYWPLRVARGGDVLAPIGTGEPTQFIHARDLADFTIKLIEEKATNIYNVVGPAKPCPLGELLETCKKVSSSDAKFIWVPQEFITENEIVPWMEFTLWIPEAEGGGLSQVSNERAKAAGLDFRSTEQIVREILAWAQTRPADHEMRAGLTAEKEEKLLSKWQKINAK
jgi:2'-hydroxyisoflavone reductase